MSKVLLSLLFLTVGVKAFQWKTTRAVDGPLLTKVLIGTPSQEVTVEVDLAKDYFFVYGQGCKNCQKNHPLFDRTKSTTFNTTTRHFYANDDKRGAVYAEHVYDNVEHSDNKEDNRVIFGLSTDTNDYYNNNSIDGVLGLNLEKGEHEIFGAASRFLGHLANESQHFTVYQNKKENEDCVKSGVITLGKHDNEHCEEKGNTFSRLIADHWLFGVSFVTIGDQKKKSSRLAFASVHLSQEISLFPIYEFFRIMTAFGSNYNNNSSKYEIECKPSTHYPNVEIFDESGENKIVIPGASLVEQVEDQCWLKAKINRKDRGSYFVLGNSILDSYCIKHDVHNRAVSFHFVKEN